MGEGTGGAVLRIKDDGRAADFSVLARAPNMYMRMYEYNHVSVAGKSLDSYQSASIKISLN